MRPVVWIAEPSLRGPGDRIASGRFTGGTRGPMVSSLDALLAATREDDAVVFVDQAHLEALSKLDAAKRPARVIAICTEALGSAVSWLQPHPWLAHVVSAPMLDHPMAEEHLGHVISALGSEKLRLLDWLGPEVGGRRIRLATASKRAARLERMTEFLSSNGVGSRTIEQLRDAAEELLTNAFYDAPVAAGAFEKPISRTVDVTLPHKLACDLAYGCRDDLAIVRVRDPFGSLSRKRLVEVLTRCARTDMGVEVDESMGGAGLGMWRVFSSASFVAINVVANSHTEILVGIAKRTPGPRPFAFHLFFREGSKTPSWKAG